MSETLPLKILIGGTIALLLFTAAAQFILFGGGELTIAPLDKLAEADIPGEILVYLDRGRNYPGYDAFSLGNDLFLAARMGECPTGGYAVHLGDFSQGEGEVFVTVEFDKPKPWDIVTQALTYPRTVSKIQLQNLPAVVVFLGVDATELARTEVTALDGE